MKGILIGFVASLPIWIVVIGATYRPRKRDEPDTQTRAMALGDYGKEEGIMKGIGTLIIVVVVLLILGSLVLVSLGGNPTNLVRAFFGTDVAIAEHEAKAAEARHLAEQELARQKEAEVDLERAKNEGMIMRAAAQSITLQSRVHAALQGVNVVILIAALIACGLLVLYILTGTNK